MEKRLLEELGIREETDDLEEAQISKPIFCFPFVGSVQKHFFSQLTGYEMIFCCKQCTYYCCIFDGTYFGCGVLLARNSECPCCQILLVSNTQPKHFRLSLTNQNIARALPSLPNAFSSGSRHNDTSCCLATSYKKRRLGVFPKAPEGFRRQDRDLLYTLQFSLLVTGLIPFFKTGMS